jgi:hypothetical protein
MALGISTEGGGGNYTPTVKINAKQGRVYRVDRSQDGAGNWQTDEAEITTDFQFVPDFDDLQIGWMYFAAGQAPNFAMVKLGEQMPDRPNADHRQGVRLKVKLGKTCGGDIREIAATAKTILGPIDKLHDEYLAGAGSNPGKAPVVRMTGMKKIDKPAEFTGGQPANEAKQEPAQTVVQAKTTSQAKPDPEPDTGEEF